ncbi:MAG TPA: hypothetical protein VJH95_04145 [Candidatus Nanoarchaeia archaeon]|nr:hypothetical protein [Candidatus Nanoarchaeia archaeon]
MDAICKNCGAIYTFDGNIPVNIACVCKSQKIRQAELPRIVINK